MAYKIFLELLDKTSSTTVVKKIQYECRNIQNFSYDISMPTNAMGIPEMFFTDAIIVKAEGNTGKLNFNWTIKNEEITPYNIISSWDSLWTTPTTGDPIPHTHGVNDSDWNLVDGKPTTYYSRQIKTTNDLDYQSYDLKTADGQMVSLSELFEKKGISSEEKHRFRLYNESDGYYIFDQEGMITRMSFQKAGTDPVTWNATLEFTLGNVLDANTEGSIGS